MLHDRYMILFPVYTFRSEPDGRQGLLVERARQLKMAPIWTDEDLFARFQPAIDGGNSRRTLNEFAELARLLRSVQPETQWLVVDPDVDAPHYLVWHIDEFLASIRFDDEDP